MTGQQFSGDVAGQRPARRGNMSSRWNRAFGILLLLSLMTAILSVLVVQQVESTFSAATDEVTRETAAFDQLEQTLTVESATAHDLLDRGSSGIGVFLAADEATQAAFSNAGTTYNSDAEHELIDEAQVQWTNAYADVRILAADAAAADTFAADTGPRGDEAHLQLGMQTDATRETLQRLDQASRSALQDRLDQAHSDKSKLLVLLGAIFALSVCATVVYARRMAQRVVHPIRTLQASADRFGSGELDHRVELHNDDEIGELADRFNVMADTIASTHRHLVVQAHHDPLTGLTNRAGFVGRLDGAVNSAPESGSVSLMFIDLDDFKHVNDELGHAAGDELLRQVAERLLSASRASDVVCRLGGDEFAVLLGTSAGEGQIAVDIADRVLAVLEQPFSVHGALIRVGASIGIASQTSPTDSGDYLLRAADVAMYAAKGQGKHRWQIFDPDIHGPVTADVSTILARLEAGDLDAEDAHIAGAVPSSSLHRRG